MAKKVACSPSRCSTRGNPLHACRSSLGSQSELALAKGIPCCGVSLDAACRASTGAVPTETEYRNAQRAARQTTGVDVRCVPRDTFFWGSLIQAGTFAVTLVAATGVKTLMNPLKLDPLDLSDPLSQMLEHHVGATDSHSLRCSAPRNAAVG